jgi:hypothetical protein
MENFSPLALANDKQTDEHSMSTSFETNQSQSHQIKSDISTNIVPLQCRDLSFTSSILNFNDFTTDLAIHGDIDVHNNEV